MVGGGIEPAQMIGARVPAPGMDGSLESALLSGTWGQRGWNGQLGHRASARDRARLSTLC